VRVRGGQRDAFARHLRTRGVESAVYYPKPLHLQRAFSNLGLGRGAFPVAEDAAAEVLSVPIFPELSSEDRALVARAMRDFFAASSRERDPLGGALS
jgi:dTDP-4-amino-4,6-dideoxygalactose transaminase